MRRPHRAPTAFALAAAVIAVALAATGCGGDPRAAILEDRARWNIDLRRWLVGEDGRIMLDTQVSGPVNSSLETLTFRVDVLDAQGQVLDEAWLQADVGSIQRGTPTGMIFRVDGVEGAEGVRIDLMRAPTDAQAERIVELRAATGS